MGDRMRKSIEFLIPGLKTIHGLFAQGDVCYERHRQAAAGRFKVTEADFNRKVMTALVACSKFLLQPHWPDLGFFKITCHVLWVDGLKSIGEKDVQGLANDFFLCVSE